MPDVTPQDHAPSAARRAPEKVWTPLVVGLITLVPGLVGLATGRVLLFPSLGPTALLQAHSPDHPTARPYNTIVAHLVGLAVGFAVVAALGLAQTKSVFELGTLSGPRVAAAVIAVTVAALLELVLRASHPPAASTTLLVALGSFKPNLRDAAALVGGVLIVVAVGELFRRLRARQP